MADHLQFWMTCDHPPADLYQLLGQQRLAPDRDALLQAARDVFRQLHAYQTHQEARSVEVARQLQRMVGEAITVFSDPASQQTYEQQTIETLKSRFARHVASSPDATQPSRIRSWLQGHESVHPGRIDELIPTLTASLPSPPQTVARPASDSPEPERPSGSRLFSGKPSIPVIPPADTQHVPPAAPNTAASPSSQKPSPPPRRSSPPRRRQSAAAPVPSQTTAGAAPASPADAAGPRRATAPRPPTGNANLLWVVGPALVTAGTLAIVAGIFIVPRLRQSAPAAQAQVDPPSSSSSSRPVRRGTEGVNPSVPSSSTAASSGTSTDGMTPQSVSEPPSSAGAATEAPSTTSQTASAQPSDATPSTSPEPTSAASAQDADSPPGAQMAATAGADSAESRPSAEATSSRPPNSSSESPPQNSSSSATADVVATITHEKPVEAIAWSPDGGRIATAGDDATIRISNAVTGEMVEELAGHTGSISQLDWHIGGAKLVSTSVDGTARIWTFGDTTDSKVYSNASSRALNCACWLPGGGKLLLGSSTGLVMRVDNPSAGVSKTFDDSAVAGPVVAICASQPDREQILATAHLDGSIFMRQSGTGAISRMLLPAEGVILGDTERLAEIASGRAKLTPTLMDGALDMSLAPSGETLAIANGSIWVWDNSDARAAVPLRLIPFIGDAQSGYRCVAWSPDGHYLASGDGTGVVNVWDAASWKIVASHNFASRVADVAWRPGDGEQLAAAYADHNVRIFNVGPVSERSALEPDAFVSVADVIDEGNTFLDDQEFETLRFAVDLLSMYRVSASTAESLQKFNFALQTEAKAMLDAIQDDENSDGPPARETLEDRLNEVLSLHQVILIDPTGPSAQTASARLKSLVRDSGRSNR